MTDSAHTRMTPRGRKCARCPGPSASSTSVPVADALRATVVSHFHTRGSPKIECGYELQPAKRLESCARRAHPYSMAGGGRGGVGQRGSDWFVSPAGAAPDPGKIDGQRKSGPGRSDALALAGNSILRIQFNPAV